MSVAGRTKLLVSVRDEREADDALAGGADWIDLKEPRHGALGAVDAVTARRTSEFVAGRAPLSAAAGELRDWPRWPARELLAVREASYIKLGLAHCVGTDWLSRWQAARDEILAAGKSLVAVIYADAAAAGAPAASDILAAAVDARCSWVLWDTFDKSNGSIDAHLSVESLAGQLAGAREAGLWTVVAGGLNRDAISRVPLEFIDMIGVRGAACRTSRESSISRERVTTLREQLSRHEDCCGSLPLSSDPRRLLRFSLRG